ncbi:MAG: fumarylacetoacetate hydrolase family protein [Rhodothermia bacterium]|nr:fumarylacetoacetate hydrolase family protein [Rhodothermia bacterium]
MQIEMPGSGRRIRPGKLICVGRNYAAHAAEMKSEIPKQPLLFLKPSTSLVGDGGSVVIPPMSSDVHHELELVLVIGQEARGVAEQDAMLYVEGYALGLDMTARDLQAEAKKGGKPWSVAKGFDTFAPIGRFVASAVIEDVGNITMQLQRNAAVVQSCTTRDMIFSPAHLVHYVSHIFTLEPGDLIFTGTPEGVGPVLPGDKLVATGDGLPTLNVEVVAAQT